MEKRQLGKTDLWIAPLTFGGNVFGWTINENTSFDLLDGFIGAGFDLVDTADVYSRWAPGNKGGESETIIGNWMKQRNSRNKVLISTKVGSDMGDGKKGVTKKYILEAAEASLKRLQTDHIDLYQTHFDDEATPVDETLEAYEQLMKAGKVRWIGTSNMTPKRIIESLEVSKEKGFPVYQTLQPHYNLSDREKFETEYQQLCIDNDLGVLSYFSLASGFLTGKYRTTNDLGKSKRGGDMDKHFNDRGFAILHALDIVSAKHNSTPASVSLAWLMAQKSIVAPIASATSLLQLESLTNAASLELTTDDLTLLDHASAWK